MKILHVIASMDPASGGPSEGVRGLSKSIQKLGHLVDIVSLDSPDAAWLSDSSSQIIGFGPGFLKYRYTPHFHSWLNRKVHMYDAVIVNGIWQYHAFAAWRALHRSNTPYFVFTHGMLDPWFRYRYPLKHIKKWLYWPWADYRLLRDARAVLFTCEEEMILARQSFSLYRANEEVVGYGTAAPPSDAEAYREVFFKQFPAIRSSRMLLFLSRIHPKKGCDLLLNAFARIADKFPDVHLVMAGPDQIGWGRDLQRLADKLGISSRITWPGMLNGDVKWGAYYSAEAFVLPSHSENFGIVVAEAMGCGTPVLISNKVNIWREIQGADAGFVAEDSLDGTASMLEKWFELTPEQRRLKSISAKRAFFDHFEVEFAARKLISVLSNHIQN